MLRPGALSFDQTSQLDTDKWHLSKHCSIGVSLCRRQFDLTLGLDTLEFMLSTAIFDVI